jgi:putative SOS response-associated peptidase YedK
MLARFFRVSYNRSAAFEPASAIFPGHVAPVVRQSADGEREIALMSWGFVLLQNGRAPRRVTNDDKILESRFWRGSFEERRCLVPATSFCELNGDVKPASWHWFTLRGRDERPIFAFPGSRNPALARNVQVAGERNLCAGPRRGAAPCRGTSNKLNARSRRLRDGP